MRCRLAPLEAGCNQNTLAAAAICTIQAAQTDNAKAGSGAIKLLQHPMQLTGAKCCCCCCLSSPQSCSEQLTHTALRCGFFSPQGPPKIAAASLPGYAEAAGLATGSSYLLWLLTGSTVAERAGVMPDWLLISASLRQVCDCSKAKAQELRSLGMARRLVAKRVTRFKQRQAARLHASRRAAQTQKQKRQLRLKGLSNTENTSKQTKRGALGRERSALSSNTHMQAVPIGTGVSAPYLPCL